MTNSKWQIHRAGLVDFWYYDEEEFSFLDGRMLLRGANGSGKSVTMQSFIPLLLDGNMRPERLDPFGSRARKMENYLLEEGDGREERTGYLYIEFKRRESDEYLTLGIGMRARRNKKMSTWYFCITDGRRVGKDILLFKDQNTRVTCSIGELRYRIGEGGQVMESQSEYAQCVNRLLFGFETQEEYKELLELLIQLRTPKLSKEFKPSLINEILSSSLQTLSEDDLRPMSEAIENMDSLKTNLETLTESIRAAEQIGRVYDQYNEIVLCDKALLFTEAAKECRGLEKKLDQLDRETAETKNSVLQEQTHYDELAAEEKVLAQERVRLADSDAARLKEQELQAKNNLSQLQKNIDEKQRQLQDKEDRQREITERHRLQAEQNEEKWDAVEERLEEMEETLADVPFDDFSFLRAEICDNRERTCSFDAHTKLLKDYTDKIEAGKEALREEEICQEAYGRQLEELDRRREEENRIERELLQWENQLHETKQELIEQVYKWERGNQELHLQPEILQDITRRIGQYQPETDIWEIRDPAKPAFEEKQKILAGEQAEKTWERDSKRQELKAIGEELQQWQNQKEPEPERSEAVRENRRLLSEREIPYRQFYQMVDFDDRLSEEDAALLEEALLEMGILDALVIPAEYREDVLALDGAVCDRYLFTDAPQAGNSLMELLDIENPDQDILLYQDMFCALSAVGVCGVDTSGFAGDPASGDEEKTGVRSGSWISERGHYGMGALEGTVTGNYKPRFIGSRSRERYRLEKIRELELLYEQKEKELKHTEEELEGLLGRIGILDQEWRAFPGGGDLITAARECERRERLLDDWKERIREQMERVDAERKKLDAVRLSVQELCRKCYLPARLDVFSDASAALREYRELLTGLQLDHMAFVNGTVRVHQLEEQLDEIEGDLDDIRYDIGRSRKRFREEDGVLNSIREQLKLTDYEKIRTRLDLVAERLEHLPSEKEASVKRRADLENRHQSLAEKRMETGRLLDQAEEHRDRMQRAFAAEYDLGYVFQPADAADSRIKQAEQVCALFGGKFGNKKQSDIFAGLQEVYHRNRGELAEYQITLRTIFEEFDDDASLTAVSMKRIDIAAKYRGTPVRFPELIRRLEEDAQMQKQLLGERDRELFEDILANTISKKIRAKILASRRWVDKMNRLMESMKTSSGLTLSLRWKNRRADTEEQLDTKELVELLQKDAEIMRPEETEQLSRHFRSKIDEARKISGDMGNVQSFHAIMREVLDYRKWFEFQLESRKTGEQKKELTDRVFYTFSGGEKAMAMYVPLFSAVAAKYAGARSDAPRLISLDEAFAGVDEMNIRDMFRLMVEFDFNFMINSQILWGDCDTVPALAIYQLIRPENARYVTVIRYVWNGKVRRMVTESEEF